MHGSISNTLLSTTAPSSPPSAGHDRLSEQLTPAARTTASDALWRSSHEHTPCRTDASPHDRMHGAELVDANTRSLSVASPLYTPQRAVHHRVATMDTLTHALTHDADTALPPRPDECRPPPAHAPHAPLLVTRSDAVTEECSSRCSDSSSRSRSDRKAQQSTFSSRSSKRDDDAENSPDTTAATDAMLYHLSRAPTHAPARGDATHATHPISSSSFSSVCSSNNAYAVSVTSVSTTAAAATLSHGKTATDTNDAQTIHTTENRTTRIPALRTPTPPRRKPDDDNNGDAPACGFAGLLLTPHASTRSAEHALQHPMRHDRTASHPREPWAAAGAMSSSATLCSSHPRTPVRTHVSHHTAASMSPVRLTDRLAGDVHARAVAQLRASEQSRRRSEAEVRQLRREVEQWRQLCDATARDQVRLESVCLQLRAQLTSSGGSGGAADSARTFPSSSRPATPAGERRRCRDACAPSRVERNPIDNYALAATTNDSTTNNGYNDSNSNCDNDSNNHTKEYSCVDALHEAHSATAVVTRAASRWLEDALRAETSRRQAAEAACAAARQSMTALQESDTLLRRRHAEWMQQERARREACRRVVVQWAHALMRRIMCPENSSSDELTEVKEIDEKDDVGSWGAGAAPARLQTRRSRSDAVRESGEQVGPTLLPEETSEAEERSVMAMLTRLQRGAAVCSKDEFLGQEGVTMPLDDDMRGVMRDDGPLQQQNKPRENRHIHDTMHSICTITDESVSNFTKKNDKYRKREGDMCNVNDCVDDSEEDEERIIRASLRQVECHVAHVASRAQYVLHACRQRGARAQACVERTLCESRQHVSHVRRELQRRERERRRACRTAAAALQTALERTAHLLHSALRTAPTVRTALSGAFVSNRTPLQLQHNDTPMEKEKNHNDSVHAHDEAIPSTHATRVSSSVHGTHEALDEACAADTQEEDVSWSALTGTQQTVHRHALDLLSRWRRVQTAVAAMRRRHAEEKAALTAEMTARQSRSTRYASPRRTAVGRACSGQVCAEAAQGEVGDGAAEESEHGARGKRCGDAGNSADREQTGEEMFGVHAEEVMVTPLPVRVNTESRISATELICNHSSSSNNNNNTPTDNTPDETCEACDESRLCTEEKKEDYTKCDNTFTREEEENDKQYDQLTSQTHDVCEDDRHAGPLDADDRVRTEAAVTAMRDALGSLEQRAEMLTQTLAVETAARREAQRRCAALTADGLACARALHTCEAECRTRRTQTRWLYETLTSMTQMARVLCDRLVRVRAVSAVQKRLLCEGAAEREALAELLQQAQRYRQRRRSAATSGADDEDTATGTAESTSNRSAHVGDGKLAGLLACTSISCAHAYTAVPAWRRRWCIVVHVITAVIRLQRCRQQRQRPSLPAEHVSLHPLMSDDAASWDEHKGGMHGGEQERWTALAASSATPLRRLSSLYDLHRLCATSTSPTLPPVYLPPLSRQLTASLDCLDDDDDDDARGVAEAELMFTQSAWERVQRVWRAARVSSCAADAPPQRGEVDPFPCTATRQRRPLSGACFMSDVPHTTHTDTCYMDAPSPDACYSSLSRRRQRHHSSLYHPLRELLADLCAERTAHDEALATAQEACAAASQECEKLSAQLRNEADSRVTLAAELHSLEAEVRQRPDMHSMTKLRHALRHARAALTRERAERRATEERLAQQLQVEGTLLATQVELRNEIRSLNMELGWGGRSAAAAVHMSGGTSVTRHTPAESRTTDMAQAQRASDSSLSVLRTAPSPWTASMNEQTEREVRATRPAMMPAGTMRDAEEKENALHATVRAEARVGSGGGRGGEVPPIAASARECAGVPIDTVSPPPMLRRRRKHDGGEERVTDAAAMKRGGRHGVSGMGQTGQSTHEVDNHDDADECVPPEGNAHALMALFRNMR